MRESARCFCLMFFTSALLLGCGGSGGGPGKPGSGSSSNAGGYGWLGIPSACKCVVEWINDGTNWALNKNQVSVAKVGDVRSSTGSGLSVADFRIAVTNGTNSFETLAKNVPCDKDGVLTEDAVTKLREAVEDIKTKIRRLQN